MSGELGGQPFADARALAELVADSPEFATCTVRALYRHALGHVEQAGEEPAISELAREFSSSGFRFDALLRALAESPAMRLVAQPER